MLFSQSTLRAVGCLLLVLSVSACSRDPIAEIVNNTVEQVILPQHQQLAASAAGLATAANRFCDNNSRTEEELAALRMQWQGVVASWSAVQLFQIGPASEKNRAWRLQFWPDLKDQSARKLQRLLAGEQAISSEQIYQSSVIVQGLSALEVLLFDSRLGQLANYTDGSPRSQRQCELLVAIAANSARVAGDIDKGWRPEGGNFAAQLTRPSPDNPQFPDSRAALTALVDTVVFGVEQIKNKKLTRPLALDGSGKGNPYRLEWWRSESARIAIEANLESIQALLGAGGAFGIDDYLQQLDGGAALAGALNTQLTQARENLAALQQPLVQLASSGERPAALLAAHQNLRELEQLLGDDLPSLLGITLSFNANDGD